jgi:uncharacterized protein
MSKERLLLDTAYIEAILNRHDQHHRLALRFVKRVENAAEVFVTEAVLLEVANALSAIDRAKADGFIRRAYRTPNTKVIGLDHILLTRGLDLYRDRPDKTWSLTDCISFVVMQDNNLTDALTTDQHFRQAGFRALLLDEEV